MPFLCLLLLLLAPAGATEFKSYKRSLTTTRSFGKTLGQPKVELYATSWCGYCVKARAYLKERGIAFSDYDIEKDPKANARYQSYGGGGIPLARIGGQTVRGFAPELYDPHFKR